MPEGRAPISSSRIVTGDIARHTFAVVRRGFDADEVRSYLQSVSRSIESLEEREQELQAALVEAEERAAHPVIDEATLTTSLGQHSGQILRHAHEEAARIVAQAQESAATLLRETQSQVDDLQERSEASSAERVVEVELMVANAQQEARTQSEQILADAAAQSDAIVARAKGEGKTLLEQVQEARRRVLSDLASRRRVLGIQIEQLRAARDEMAASVHGVRDRVDLILGHLDGTDDRARAAAHGVGDQFRVRGTELPHDQDAAHEVAADAGEPAPPGSTSATGTADPGTDEVEAGGPATTLPSVDELFARIRAGTDETVETAGTAEAGDVTSTDDRRSAADAAGAEQLTEAVAVVGPATEAVVVEEAPTAVVPSQAAATTTVGPEPEGDENDADEPAVEPGPDDELIARRDELLGPLAARLSRSIKRALGDDQNRLLDQLRHAPSLTADELLGPEDDHVAAYAGAARKQLGDAFAAGTVFAGGKASAVPEGDAVEQASTGLARSVVALLRRQVAAGSGDTSDRVGAAFREWRGERVERLTGDSATHAFSAGVRATVARGKTPAKMRWVVTSAEGCSDCADNALAGTLGTNETFPTGHSFPPAHSGCRCLVTPADG